MANAGGSDDRSGHDESAAAAADAEEERTSKDCAAIGVSIATVLGVTLTVHVLELSVAMCIGLYAWAGLITRILTPEGHRIGGDTLRRMLWWIVDAGAVAVLAGWAFGTVAAMLVMYFTSLCVAGLFAWCMIEFFRTRNSIDTTSTSHEQDKPAIGSGVSQDVSSQKKNSGSANAKQYQPLDLEAGIRRDK